MSRRRFRNMMREQRRWAEANRDALLADWNALPDVPRTIEQHLNTPLRGAQ